VDYDQQPLNSSFDRTRGANWIDSPVEVRLFERERFGYPCGENSFQNRMANLMERGILAQGDGKCDGRCKAHQNAVEKRRQCEFYSNSAGA